MPISPFVAALRKKIGTDLLCMAGVNAVVLNDRNEMLLVHSRDTNEWMPVGGMIEPGEEPADAAIREVLEETSVQVSPIRLAGVYDGPDVTYSNGDRVHYITIVFLCKAVAGEPRANDDENFDARYFPVDHLPRMRADHQRNVTAALSPRPQAFFQHRNA